MNENIPNLTTPELPPPWAFTSWAEGNIVEYALPARPSVLDALGNDLDLAITQVDERRRDGRWTRGPIRIRIGRSVQLDLAGAATLAGALSDLLSDLDGAERRRALGMPRHLDDGPAAPALHAFEAREHRPDDCRRCSRTRDQHIEVMTR